MGKPLIMMTSITYAMKAKDLLLRNGIRADLVRTPRHENVGGCGYSLYVPKNTDKAENLLKEANIKILGRADRDGVT